MGNTNRKQEANRGGTARMLVCATALRLLQIRHPEITVGDI
jgi:hypothetical protein